MPKMLIPTVQLTNNGLWDIITKKSSITITDKLVENGELIVKFGFVNSGFMCENLNLVTLKGCPHTVYGNFNCSYNNLENLFYGPKDVGFSYICSNNKLKTLNGCPNVINYTLDCSYNELETLDCLYFLSVSYLKFNNNKIKELTKNVKFNYILCYKNKLNHKHSYINKYGREYNGCLSNNYYGNDIVFFKKYKY
jgi:hypothetical protein